MDWWRDGVWRRVRAQHGLNLVSLRQGTRWTRVEVQELRDKLADDGSPLALAAADALGSLSADVADIANQVVS